MLISLNLDGVTALKNLFGVNDDKGVPDSSPENVNYIKKLADALSSKINDDNDHTASVDKVSNIRQVYFILVRSLLHFFNVIFLLNLPHC